MSLILQRDDMVTKARDIRPLLARRMDLWEARRLPELLHQAQRCDQQRKKKRMPMSREHIERVFSRLMLQGRVCAY